MFTLQLKVCSACYGAVYCNAQCQQATSHSCNVLVGNKTEESESTDDDEPKNEPEPKSRKQPREESIEDGNNRTTKKAAEAEEAAGEEESPIAILNPDTLIEIAKYLEIDSLKSLSTTNKNLYDIVFTIMQRQFEWQMPDLTIDPELVLEKIRSLDAFADKLAESNLNLWNVNIEYLWHIKWLREKGLWDSIHSLRSVYLQKSFEGNLPLPSNLRTLSLWWYQDENLVDVLRPLKNLTSLSLMHYDRENLVDVLGKLKNLTSLSLMHYRRENLADALGKLKNLTSLRLDQYENKNLAGALIQLSNLTSLRLGQYESKNLAAALIQLSNLTSLTLLRYNRNNLVDALGQLKNLKFLTLVEYNQPNLVIPPWIRKFYIPKLGFNRRP